MPKVSQDELFVFFQGGENSLARSELQAWLTSPVTVFLTQKFRDYEKFLTGKITNFKGSLLDQKNAGEMDKLLAELTAVRVYIRLTDAWRTTAGGS